MPLGNHLRPHDNVDASLMDRLESRFSSRFATHTITINAHHACLRPNRLNGFFDALRTGSNRQDFRIAAHRTALRNFVSTAAMVTNQTFFRFMKYRKARAMHATRYPTAGRAADHRRISSPINENQHLTTRFNGLRHRLLDLFGKNSGFAL